jgi:hypothetical protein
MATQQLCIPSIVLHIIESDKCLVKVQAGVFQFMFEVVDRRELKKKDEKEGSVESWIRTREEKNGSPI